MAREQQIRKFQKQGKELLETGAKEGIKMGFQQVLGLIIAEFFEASFDEVLDIYKNGYSKNASDESIVDTLKSRCATIKNRVIQRMKNDALEVGMNAFISGFLSNWLQ